MSGLFISFEGTDGCGKSTQLNFLHTALQFRYPERLIVATKNPGGTELGRAIRKLLLTPTEQNMDLTCELLLYMADRAQHVAEEIRPTLEAGGIVLCDRFHDSTLAYQGYGRGLDLELIRQLNHTATGGLMPHQTFWLDGPVEVLYERVEKRGEPDRLEREGLLFQDKIRQGFAQLHQADPERIRQLDATQPANQLAEQVIQSISL